MIGAVDEYEDGNPWVMANDKSLEMGVNAKQDVGSPESVRGARGRDGQRPDDDPHQRDRIQRG